MGPVIHQEAAQAEGLRARIVARHESNDRDGHDRSSSFTLDIELEVGSGQTAALLGPNGSGKSTTVDVLAGIMPLDDGRIELNGRLLDEPSSNVYVATDHRNVGVVFQQSLLFEHLNVLDNLAFGPATNSSRRVARQKVKPWIEAFDLGRLLNRRPSELSGGEAQRVALARTLAAEPELLLLDEPLAAVDVTARTELRRTLRGCLAEFAGPRLLITHDPSDAFLLADRIHVLEGGSVVQTGTPQEIRLRPRTPFVAALAGLNLMTASNDSGVLTIDDAAISLRTSNTATQGPVLVTIAPNAVALHLESPHGSPRNAWPTVVASVEPLGDITRIGLDRPLPLSVDVTPDAVAAMDLRPGLQIWASVKATEIQLDAA